MSKIIGAGKTIENITSENISISVDSLGAKVLSINIDGKNILFYDKDDIKHSGIPICLPFFGPLKNGIIKIDGKEYQIGQHGFFRNSEFNMIKKDNMIICTLESSDKTMMIYPYKFHFSAQYELINNGLKMVFVLKNNDEKVMDIAPGFHPYFAVKNRDEVYFTTMSKTGNDSLNGTKVTKLEETGVFNIISENNSIKKTKVINAPNIQLINHRLNKTTIIPGDDNEIILNADMEIFNRMTIWRDNVKDYYICVEPSFVNNAVNDGLGLKIESGGEFQTTLSIVVKT